MKSPLFKGFHPQPPSFHCPTCLMCPGMEWAADSAAVLRFHRSKEQLLKLVHPFFFVTWGLPWAHRAANQQFLHQPWYHAMAMIPTAFTRLDVWCFRGDGMLTCPVQNAAFISQICWRTRPATDSQTLCTCVYKTKIWTWTPPKHEVIGNIMIIIVISYSTYCGISTLWIWFFSPTGTPKPAVPNSPLLPTSWTWRLKGVSDMADKGEKKTWMSAAFYVFYQNIEGNGPQN